jgi:hypothetical protein
MKNRLLVVGLCLLVLTLLLVSACGSKSTKTATPTTTATNPITATTTPTQAATATNTATKTAAPTITTTATATATPTPTPASGGGAAGSLSDILGKGATLTSIKYDMIVTSEDSETMQITVWQKMPKMKEQMTAQGMDTIIFMDMDQQVMYTYMPDQNMATKMTLNTSMMPQGSTDEDKIMDYNPLVVGTETIDGKSCTVITYDVPGTGSIKEWIWTDKGFPIKLESTVGGKTSVVEFKNIDFSNIPDSEFELPAGVQVIEMGG